jgi:chromosome partitioning protein
MVDLDPQASLTTSCGIQEAELNLTSVFGGGQPGNLPLSKILHFVSKNLFLAPSNLDMAAVELGINSRLGREYILAEALGLVSKDFDLVLIDCPPSLSLLAINALAASQAVLIPVQPMPVDVAALRLFLKTVEGVKRINPALSILGILPTFYDARLTAHNSALQAMEQAGWPVLPFQVGRSVRVGEAGAMGQSIINYDPSNPQAEAYENVGKAVIKWLEKTI